MTNEEFKNLSPEKQLEVLKALYPDRYSEEIDYEAEKKDFDISTSEIPKVRGAVKIKL